jgi:hypothetical protein
VAARAGGSTRKASAERPELVEQGSIYFIFRPRVEEQEPSGLEDVERFYVVLRPDRPRLWRLIVIGRKRLPEIDDHERNWGFVDLVTRKPDEVRSVFGPAIYETKTRGERHLPASRPAGEGVYALVRRGRELHLVYRLELPKNPGAVQSALGIDRHGNFVLAVKNPEKPAPPGVGLDERQKPDLPDEVEEEFRGRRFETERKDPLDYAGAEIVLIGARHDTRIGGEDAPRPERETANSSDLLQLLRPERIGAPTEPLLEGVWG